MPAPAPHSRYTAAHRRAQAHPRRSTLSYWVPLIVTVTLATAGLAAWIWSERDDGDSGGADGARDAEDEDEDEGIAYEYEDDDGRGAGRLGAEEVEEEDNDDGGYGDDGEGRRRGAREAGQEQEQQKFTDDGFLARALRRTPSPQIFFDSAGQRIAAGVAAAGAAVGGALGSLREREEGEEASGRVEPRTGPAVDEPGFSDHERWSEEAGRRVQGQMGRAGGVVEQQQQQTAVRDKDKGKQPTRTVAIVVSAALAEDSALDDSHNIEHASILSHLPPSITSSTRLFVLIYAPHLTSLPPPPAPATSPSSSSSPSPTGAPSALSSTYSLVAPPTPDTSPSSSSTRANQVFSALSTRASSLVAHPSMVLPFTTPTGYIHLLRHLAPSLVYIPESQTLCGAEGETVAMLRGWVGQVVVVLGGGEEGGGGLVDSESEGDEGVGEKGREAEVRSKWWEGSEMVGLGKGVDVVDVQRFGDDWARRVAM